MIYDQQDIFRRIKATLPGRWFGEDTPILDSVLKSLSAGWLNFFKLLEFVRMQTRIHSAFDASLDLIARDYFGQRIQRRPQETNDSFRQRICTELLRDRCTRAAIYDVLQELTGRPPIIFEPTNPQDTGCYGLLGLPELGSGGYCTSGGWGSLNLPFQAFVRAFRMEAAGIAMVNGWGGSIGAFGGGFSAYISSNTNMSSASDSEIYEAVSRTAPVGTIIWLSIEP
jgi:hypothetical protein